MKNSKALCLIFLDTNKTNCDISNLKLIKRKDLLVMNRNKMFIADAELTNANSNVAALMNARYEAIKRQKTN